MSVKACVIGIDGGGTKTHLLCTSLEGDVLAEVYGGSSNLCSNSAQMVRANLIELFERMYKTLGEEVEILGVCLGTAGLIAKGAKEQLTEMLTSLTKATVVEVVGDMETALVANIEDEAGVLIISGTGAIGCGMDLNHQTYRSGGWGHLVGDEGSAYWIAMQGLRYALKGYDGRGSETALYEAFKKELGVKSHQALISMLYQVDFNKMKMAALSRVVAQIADEGDEVARLILKEAGDELAYLCASIIKKMKLDDLGDFKIICSGSVLVKNNLVRCEFSDKMKIWYPCVNIQLIDQEAAWGAVKLALKGVHLDESHPIKD